MVLCACRKIVCGILFGMVFSQMMAMENEVAIPRMHQRKIFTDSMIAVLPSLKKIDKKILYIVQDLTYDKSPADIVKELAAFYTSTGKPAITAIVDLVRQKKYVNAAIDIAQLLLQALPDNSPRASEINQWVSDLDEILTCIEYVLIFIKDNPQLMAMIVK